jgi:hypothetical protein
VLVPVERRAVALAAATVCALEVSDAFAQNCADALYLSRRGAAGLGAQLAASSALLAITLALVGALADRGGRARLLGRLAVAAAVLLAAARLALALAPAAAPAALLVLTKQLSAALELGFWIVVADRFDARQARRVVPLVMAAGGAGLVAGSLATRAVVALVGVEDLLVLAAGACLLAATLVRGLDGPSVLRPAVVTRGGGSATRDSELARRLFLVIAAAGAFGPVLYTALGAAAAARFAHEADLAGFYGRFRGVTNLATLVAQAALAPGLLRALGVGAAFLVAPVAAVAAGAALAARSDLLVAAIAQASARLADAAVETPAEKLAQNLLPRDVRGRIAGFLDGVAKRGGALAGGLLAWMVVDPGRLGLVAAGVGGVWLVAALALRRRFPVLAVDGLAATKADATQIDEAATRVLAAQLAGPDDARRALAIEVVMRAPPARAATLLVAAARHVPPGPSARARLVVALDRVLEHDFAPPPGLGDDLLDLLRDSRAPLERATLVQAVGRLGDPARLAPVLGDDEPPAVRLAAACARGSRDEALLETFLSSDDATLRAIAFEELRLLARRSEAAAPALARLARSGTPVERAVAFDALARAGARGPILAAAAEALDDGPVEVRAAALAALGALAEPRLAPLYARALADRTDEVRDAAAAALVRLGAAALPALLVAARFGRRSARHAALEALRDLEARPGEDLVDSELTALRSVSGRRRALAGLGARPAGRLFLDRLDERRAEVARTLLLTIEVVVGDRNIGRAAESLPSPRALEALDALLPRGIARRVLPALEDEAPDVPEADAALRAELAGDDPLARVLLVRALGAEARAHLRDAIRAAARAGADDLDPARLLSRVHNEEDSDVPRSVDTMLFLREIALFSELTPSQLAELAAACAWVTVGPGERVEPDGLVVVASGALGAAGPGSVVGAAALFGDPAPPPLVATERTRLLRLSRAAFERAVEDTPAIAIGICRVLQRSR